MLILCFFHFFFLSLQISIFHKVVTNLVVFTNPSNIKTHIKITIPTQLENALVDKHKDKSQTTEHSDNADLHQGLTFRNVKWSYKKKC